MRRRSSIVRESFVPFALQEEILHHLHAIPDIYALSNSGRDLSVANGAEREA